MSNAVENALNRASAKNKEGIENAKQHVESIKDSNEVQSQHTPSKTPPNPSGLENKQLDPETKSNIENTQQSEGNNYQNAVDRAQARPTQDNQPQPPSPDKER